MKSGIATVEMVAELQRLAERAFVYKFRQKNPDASPEQIEEAVCEWYKERPGAEHGDADGRVVDPSKFNLT